MKPKRYYHYKSWFKVNIIWSVTSWQNKWIVKIKPYKIIENRNIVFDNSRLVPMKDLLLLS